MQKALDGRWSWRRNVRSTRLAALCVLFTLACEADQAKQGVVPDASDATPDASATPTKDDCTGHGDCVALHGAHWICRPDRQCVSLLSPECTQVRGNDTSDDAVIVGALANEGTPLFGVADLARSDFEQTVGGFPVRGETKPRPFVLVGCQYPVGGDPLPAARYLVETIGVSAIVGGQGSQPTIAIAQVVTIPAGVLLISSLAQSDLITNLDDHDLVFRTSPTSKGMAPMLSKMITSVEATVREARSLDKVKVALVWPRDAFGLALSAAARPLLKFNGGLSIEQNETNGDFLEVSYDAMSSDFEVEPARRVREFGASIVISLSSAEQRAFQAIEETWPDDQAPFHLIVSGFAPETGKFVATRPDSLRRRLRFLFALDPSRPLYAPYLARVEGAFGPSQALVTTPAAYDATYALAFGIIAADEKRPSGAAIARGIRRLVGPGESIDAVPDAIARGVENLQMGKSIDLDGTSGPLDFDDHGDVVVDSSVYCLIRDKEGGDVSLVFSGQVYRAKTGAFEGAPDRCDGGGVGGPTMRP